MQSSLASRLSGVSGGTDARRRAIRDGLSLAGLIVIVWLFYPLPANFGFDAHSYWGYDLHDLYRGTESANGIGTFRYAPAFAQLLAPLSALPFSTFLLIWDALLVGTLVWLGGRWALAFCVIPFIPGEIVYGNIHLLLAAAIVLGFRYPWTWAFVLLTKVTPGIGLLWFVVRREWRNLAIAIAGTAVVIVASAALAPDLWPAWIRSLANTPEATGINHVPIPLLARLPVAALVVTWGALTNRPWTVPLASMIALPTIWSHSLSMIAGSLALLLPARRAWFRRRADPLVVRSVPERSLA
jgi:hypothetical protein